MGQQSAKTRSIFDFTGKIWLPQKVKGKPKASDSKNFKPQLLVFSTSLAKRDILGRLKERLNHWQLDFVKQSSEETFYFDAQEGPLWLVIPQKATDENHYGVLNKVPYAKCRDLTGSFVRAILRLKLKSLHVSYFGSDREEALGALVGLELGAYRYQKVRANKSQEDLPTLLIGSGFEQNDLDRASALATSQNLARHLVNVPANELNPGSYAESLVEFLGHWPDTKIEVWDERRLKKEKLNLILAVGKAAEEKPRLIHIRYRPRGAKQKPLAFVGKGVTFDSGGLDLKPASGMRLMKKDMGGSATVAGLAYWFVQEGIKIPADFYILTAENAVAGNAFRPSDIITARNGKTVEIHNTDAEGRLLLADDLQIACSQKGADKPALVMDVATLTGAIKVALGVGMFGLFATEDKLAEQIMTAGNQYGDLCWRLPLYQPYMDMLKSDAASFANAASGGFAGSITAALFLQQFVGDCPWVHLDIYAWAGGPDGALVESGGSGQALQCLVGYVSRLV